MHLHSESQLIRALFKVDGDTTSNPPATHAIAPLMPTTTGKIIQKFMQRDEGLRTAVAGCGATKFYLHEICFLQAPLCASQKDRRPAQPFQMRAAT